MCPQNNKKGRVAHISEPAHEWDPERRRTQSPRGRVRGVQGASPPGGGSWGVSPHKFKRGE